MISASAIPARSAVRSRPGGGLLLAAGVLGAGALLAGTGVPWQLLLALGVAGAAAAAAVWAVIAWRRRLVEDLRAALVAVGGPGTVVRCSRWDLRAVRNPIPRKIRISYEAGARDWDPKWLPQLLAIVESRVDCAYVSTAHQTARKRVFLEVKGEEEESAAPSARGELEQRAKTTVGELLGKDARPKMVWAGDELEKIDVVFDNATALKLTSSMKRQQIERVVTAMLPGRWRAQWDVEASRVRFELRPHMPEVVPHPPIQVTDANRWSIPQAVTEDGETVCWELRSTEPHGLTTGKTGTGKTVDLMGIAMEWAARDWAVWVADPKRIEFIGLRRWPNVQIVAGDIEQQLAMIHAAWELMERRYEQIERGGDERDFEPLLLMLDEYTDLKSGIDQWWSQNKHKGAPTKCPVYADLSSLARKARSARIHLRFGTQRPDAEFMTGEMRDNLSDRHSLGRLSPEGARMMWGAVYIGASVPKRIPGRGISQDAEGRPVETQSYWTPDPRRALRDGSQKDLEILRSLLPPKVTHKRFVFEIADEDSAVWLDDNGKSTYTPWAAVVEARKIPAPDVDEPFTLEPGNQEDEMEDGAVEVGPPPPTTRLSHLRLVREVDERDDEGDGYGPLVELTADRLQTGDLVRIDEEWVVVESAIADLEDEGMVSISWRSDDDDAGELALDAGDVLEARRADDDVLVDVLG